MRRTKIVCTVGPACDGEDVLGKMLIGGMDIARLNLSHGTPDEHRQRIAMIRRAAAASNKTIAIMADTKGPEIRTGEMQGGKALLESGSQVIVTTEPVVGNASRFTIGYRDLPRDLRPGSMILIADGILRLQVENIVNETELACLVVDGGELGNHKGVILPGVEPRLPAVTDQDQSDIRMVAREKVDFIAASFIRRAEDVLALRKIIEGENIHIDIIAKIENRSGVENIDDILAVADGIMVARGDLGVEIPAEEVPLVQKEIIRKCNLAGKPVITATQMLESMISNPRPTRAEASDVANAILDGTDAIMLSGETAAGKYPVQAVETMARIACRAEEAIHHEELLRAKGINHSCTVTDAISHATCTIALELGAAAIITPTASGSTARMVSKYRPGAPVIAASANADVLRRLCVVWGVVPLLVESPRGTDEMIGKAVDAALEAGLISQGDLVVVTAGIPAGIAGTTNLLKVHIVGRVLVKGTGIGHQAAAGRVRIALTAGEAVEKVENGDILVTSGTDKDFIPAMEKAGAIITETGGLTSHAAIVAINMGIPAVVGVKEAIYQLTEGDIVTVDGTRGLVYHGVTRVL
ncbi:MAG: pyruvate kinase [Bacillota bacterium]